MKVTVTVHNAGPHTIWGVLAKRLGREPTGDEVKAEMFRILDDVKAKAAKKKRGGK